MIQKTIKIEEELYNKAKAAAARRGMDLIMPDGWIAEAISEKIEKEGSNGKG